MKLTSELLTGVYEKSAELQRLDLVMQYNEVREDLQNLNAQITGCQYFLDELTIANESLKKAGYSTEWFDIINKDNNFMTVVDLDMPKFFGGDEAKQAACEGAIIDTIKKWSKAVWEWIKSVWDKMKKALKWLKELWVHDSRPRGEVIQTYQKVVGMMEKSNDPQVRAQFDYCFSDLSMRDPKVLGNWIDSYGCLADVLNEIATDIDKLLSIEEYAAALIRRRHADGSPLTEEEKQMILAPHQTNLVTETMNSTNNDFAMVIVTYWGAHPLNPIRKTPPTIAHNGFEFTRGGGMGTKNDVIITTGIAFGDVFTDDDNFPRVAQGFSDYDKADRDLYITNMKETCEKAGKLLEKIQSLSNGKMKTIVEQRAKKANDFATDPKVDENSDAAQFARFQLLICRSCLNICNKLLAKAGIMTTNLNKEQRIVLTRMAEFRKNFTGNITA